MEPTEATYDIVCFFQCLHDMGWPTKALMTIKKMLKKDGVLLVAESPGDFDGKKVINQ